MDIFNRPHSIAEDTLHFTIYPPPHLSEKASVISFAACITSYAESLLPVGFIWHRDKFDVKLSPSPDNEGWVLESRIRVGDSVDDEWCTVWLLKEVSSKWDVVISAYDSDGEFLLIEAAEALPSWVKPTNSENRVWIYNSRLHLIPLSHVSPPSRKRNRRKLPGAVDSDDEVTEIVDDDVFIAAEDAVKIVRDPTIDTPAPAEVEKIVWQRISSYPEAATTHVHVTKAYLPLDIATVLVVNPSLVQKAVETFYTRDAIQLHAVHRMSRFPPTSSILTSVRMTRTAYAQLLGQKFFPPKVFGHWKEQEGTKECRWREVGMKIAVGFEMLYQESKNRLNGQKAPAESAEASKEALRRDPEYQKYIQNLVSAGYFKSEVEGSEFWNALENKAASTFVEIRRTDDASRQSFASQINAALANKNVPDHGSEEEDPDDWLSVDSLEFEKMLEATLAHPKYNGQRDPNAMDVDDMNHMASAEDRLASEQAKHLKDLAAKVQNFVEGEGDLEGAIFEDEKLSDDDLFSDEAESSDSESEAEPQSGEARSAEKQVAMDKLVPALEPSDYGKMPASFHSNSQRVAPANVETDFVFEEPVKEKISSSEAKTTPRNEKPVRQPIIPRDKYDGVDSDDETDEEEDEDDESEEDRPQVVGEIEIDMDEEEEEFLEFSRQALGISDAQWSQIVKDRKDRGAFLPNSVSKPTTATKKPVDPIEKKSHVPRVPEPGPRPNVNPELDSFEAVMKALDEALLSSRKPSQHAPDVGQNRGKGKEKAKGETSMDIDGEDVDVDAAMDAELKEVLEGYDSDPEQPTDYGMIRNFLESFKSQDGLSGPFSNLAGRLNPDFSLPRDES